MSKNAAVALLGMVLFALPSIRAHAEGGNEGFIGAGVRFAWNNYKTPILVYDGMGAAEPGLSSIDYGGPNFGGLAHWGITNQFVLGLSIDFGYFTHNAYPFPDSGIMHFQSAVQTEFYTIGGLLEIKYYFADPKPKDVVLYVTVGGGAYFSGSASNAQVTAARDQVRSEWNKENPGGSDDKFKDAIKDDPWKEQWQDAEDTDQMAQASLKAEVEMIGSLASPIVAQATFGIEFYATRGFSVGADILGLRFAIASADVGRVQGSTIDTAKWTGDQRYMNFYIFSALTMNFSFFLDGSAAPEEEEAEGEDWVEPGDSGWEDSGSGWQGSSAPASPAPAARPAPSAPAASDSGWSTSGEWSTSTPEGEEDEEEDEAKTKPKRKKKKKSTSTKSTSPKKAPPPPPTEF